MQQLSPSKMWVFAAILLLTAAVVRIVAGGSMTIAFTLIATAMAFLALGIAQGRRRSG